MPQVSVPKLDLRKIVSVEEHAKPACYQDEFMANLDDYSKSWREAALKDQRT